LRNASLTLHPAPMHCRRQPHEFANEVHRQNMGYVFHRIDLSPCADVIDKRSGSILLLLFDFAQTTRSHGHSSYVTNLVV